MTAIGMQSWTCVDGVRIIGEVLGKPGAPCVILAHGGGQTRRAWGSTAASLAQNGYLAVTYDMRGHGQSGWAGPGGYDEAGLVCDLQTIVEAIGDPHPVLVGASAGGIAALAAVGGGRISASALCLVDIAARTERKGYDRIRAFMLAGQAGFPSIDAAADALAQYRGQERRPGSKGLEKALRTGNDGRLYWHWDPAFLEARHQDIDLREARLTGYATLVDCPVLLIRGANSDVVSLKDAEHFIDLCPQTEFANIADAGHMMVGDRNDQFGSALMRFLKTVRNGSARHRERT